jgi:hypothetical protein
MARDGIRKAVRMSSNARIMLTEKRVEDGDTFVERILDETNTQLEEPEGNRRRSVIAHMRAAVAATRADRILLGRKKDVEQEAAPYRADLATAVVHPGRPHAVPSERGIENRGSPPQEQVTQQRVDARNADETVTVTVIQRQSMHDGTSYENRELDEDDRGFTDFAAQMGAAALAEIFEAAAAYVSFVEGHDQFSRNQILTRVDAVETARSSSQDRMRLFEQLLRDGAIIETHDGQFTASERIRFKPSARDVG